MRVSRLKAEENRAAVVDAAARLVRERGLDGLGVAEVMRAAGLTHGGFYGQFPGGKNALAAEAIASAFAGTRALWDRLAEGKTGHYALVAITESYLSEQHCAHPGYGCPVPSLAADAAREGGLAQVAFTSGVHDLLVALARHIAAETEDARMAGAACLLSTLAGAVMIARATNDAALARTVLRAAADAFGGSCPSTKAADVPA